MTAVCARNVKWKANFNSIFIVYSLLFIFSSTLCRHFLFWSLVFIYLFIFFLRKKEFLFFFHSYKDKHTESDDNWEVWLMCEFYEMLAWRHCFVVGHSPFVLSEYLPLFFYYYFYFIHINAEICSALLHAYVWYKCPSVKKAKPKNEI